MEKWTKKVIKMEVQKEKNRYMKKEEKKKGRNRKKGRHPVKKKMG